MMARPAGMRWRALVGVAFAAGKKPVQAMPPVIPAIQPNVSGRCFDARAFARA
jgi:hypothetical protein